MEGTNTNKEFKVRMTTAQWNDFQIDLSTEISKYTAETAQRLPTLAKGSLASWTTRKLERRRQQDWQTESLNLLATSWLCAPDWRIERPGILLTNDIIAYAVTCLPRRFAKNCLGKLFGSPANNFAAIELLLIGHALWQPDCGIHFNPYTADETTMEWGEVLAIENRIRHTGRQT